MSRPRSLISTDAQPEVFLPPLTMIMIMMTGEGGGRDMRDDSEEEGEKMLCIRKKERRNY